MLQKEELITKAEEILQKGGIGREDLMVWQGVLSRVSPAAVSLFIDIMKEDSSMLGMLTENLKKKIAAGDDPVKIQEIILEEKMQLNEFIEK